MTKGAAGSSPVPATGTSRTRACCGDGDKDGTATRWHVDPPTGIRATHFWEALCQAPLWRGFGNPRGSARPGGRVAGQSPSLEHSGGLFSLEFLSAQQPGRQILWRPDLLLLPSRKAEFRMDFPVPYSALQALLWDDLEVKDHPRARQAPAVAQCDGTGGQVSPTQPACWVQEARLDSR